MKYVSGKKHACLMGICVAIVLFAVGTCLFYNHVIAALDTISPNRDYRVSYNRLTKTITLTHMSTEITWHEAGCNDPLFLWSPNGEFLARSITNANGTRRAEILDLERSVTMTTLNKSSIHMQYNELFSHSDIPREQIEITEWLDDNHVLIRFSWPSDVPGNEIAGWCVYDIRQRLIKELSVMD